MQLHHHYDQNGNPASPLLSSTIKNYLIDIDGTICEDIPNEQPERMATAQIIDGALDYVNNLYNLGHRITFFTSRIESVHGSITEAWLQQHGFKYHGILYGKPRGGNYCWIDNCSVEGLHFNGSFENLQPISHSIVPNYHNNDATRVT